MRQLPAIQVGRGRRPREFRQVETLGRRRRRRRGARALLLRRVGGLLRGGEDEVAGGGEGDEAAFPELGGGRVSGGCRMRVVVGGGVTRS